MFLANRTAKKTVALKEDASEEEKVTDKDDGGSVILVDNSLEVEESTLTYSDNHTEGCGIFLNQSFTIVCSVYKPPIYSFKGFKGCIDKIKEYIDSFKRVDHISFATDISLNHELSYQNVDNEYVPVIRSSNQCEEQEDLKKTLDEREDLRKTRNKDRASASVLVQFAEQYNLQQVLTEPTYKAPSAKLSFTGLVYITLPLTDKLDVFETGMSDHFLIGAKTTVETALKEDTPKEAPKAKLARIKQQTVNFDQVAEQLKEYDWENSFKNKPVHDQVTTFRDAIYDAMIKSGANLRI